MTKEQIEFMRFAPPVGSRVVVVGGCGGIGRMLCDVADDLGLQVIVLDLSTSISQKPPKDGIKAIAIDATDEVGVKAAFQAVDAHFDAIDVLINLVGFRNRVASIEDLSVDEWDEVMAGNLRSAFLITQSALPRIRNAGSGTIVHVASAMGKKAVPHHSPYAVSKAGLIMLTQATSIEVAPSIRVNAVAPSAVDTEFHRGGTGRAEQNDAAGDPSIFIAGVPMGRIATPEDVIGPILFFAGPQSAFITGQTLLINGGR